MGYRTVSGTEYHIWSNSVIFSCSEDTTLLKSCLMGIGGETTSSVEIEKNDPTGSRDLSLVHVFSLHLAMFQR